ncbi:DEAD/DEAH box helicase [Pseudoduganella sp. GCM10020061]|uniref:DEAD/DEAH box helicase n=1 Tax=Pseudoduganella sp. GCM10020061 TaxID=3317345 RepID=UPI003635C384
MSKQWGGLRPDQVSKAINFDDSDADWNYVAGAAPSIASRQVEGVARLWNLLSTHRVALLADEVGMGKTFQALGVATLLWRMKPDAKILVMAPNRNICDHWLIEFETFVERHYRHADDRVKCRKNGEAVPRVGVHYQLEGLAEAIETRAEQQRPPQLYVTTIHSLSGLVGDANEKDKTGAASRAAARVHRRILTALDGAGFDLVIVDEAHYFRNKYGGSQRAAAAEAFFGHTYSRIGQRTLVLTATPSHTHLGDVSNILGYFTDLGEPEHQPPAEKLMQKYAVRRFRIMAGTDAGYTKHQYRREIATACDFSNRPQAEAFFAMYQRKLIHELGVLSEGRRVLYGFLEGFESSGPDEHAQTNTNGNAEPSDHERSEDFLVARDTQLLRDMSREYRAIFGCAPDHPKYGGMVEQCAPDGLFAADAGRPLHEDKHLVFVRRIPSVRELTKRVNERYDRLFAQQLCAAWDLDANDPRVLHWGSKHHWSRDGFNELVGDNKAGLGDLDADMGGDGDDDGGGSEAIDHAQDSYLGSKITDLFVTKKVKDKTTPPPPTDCSRFSLSLRRSSSIHAMFMEPASDYLAGGYTEYYTVRHGDKPRPDYTKAARARRLSTHGLISEKEREALHPADAVTQSYDDQVEIETLWSLVFPHLNDAQQATLRRWAESQPAIAENFSNYIQAGFLFASPVIVELYCWHTRFQRTLPASKQHNNVQQRYQDFVAWVRKRIACSLLLKYFAAALDTFEQLCSKIVKHKANDWRKGWRTLTTLSNPASHASGESSHRHHLILGFNSPFYPNTLVATSVFQEGINLHLQCRKVHHYGIAWTPGDNEQRVGRIDRLFGKVSQLLREQHAGTGTASLDINYPYLKNSFDEDQVGSFMERKHAVEEQIDRCVHGDFDKHVHLMRPGWQEFLRRPVTESSLDDPYPAVFESGDVPTRDYPGSL